MTAREFHDYFSSQLGRIRKMPESELIKDEFFITMLFNVVEDFMKAFLTTSATILKHTEKEYRLFGGLQEKDLEIIKNATDFSQISDYLLQIKFDIEPLKQVLYNHNVEIEKKNLGTKKAI